MDQLNVKDEDGRVLSEENEVFERRKQYFEGLSNVREGWKRRDYSTPGTIVMDFDKADKKTSN